MIPLAGPLIVASEHRERDAIPTGGYIAWTLVEAAGLGMLLAGIHGHDVPARATPPRRKSTVSLVPALSPQAGAVALNVTW